MGAEDAFLRMDRDERAPHRATARSAAALIYAEIYTNVEVLARFRNCCNFWTANLDGFLKKLPIGPLLALILKGCCVGTTNPERIATEKSFGKRQQLNTLCRSCLDLLDDQSRRRGLIQPDGGELGDTELYRCHQNISKYS